VREVRALVSFDLSSIPDGVIVKKAVLTLRGIPKGKSSFLYRNSNGYIKNEGIINIFNMNTFWSESSITNSVTDYGSYSDKFDLPAIDTVFYNNETTEAAFDITGKIANMVSGNTENYGFMITVSSTKIGDTLAMSWSSWHSSQTTNQEYRPKLVVKYEEEPTLIKSSYGEKKLGAQNTFLSMKSIFSNANVEFTLSEASAVKISLYNSSGRNVVSTKENYSSGQHTIDFQEKGLSQGVYILKISSGGEFVKGRLIIR